MILFAEATTELVAAIVGCVGGGGIVGLLVRFVRSAGATVGATVPTIVENFGKFVTTQLDAAKADREAAAEERATSNAAHARQLDQRDQMFMAELERRDKLFASEIARLAEAVGRNTAVTESLSATVAVLAARVGVDHKTEPVAIAPMPKPASSRNQKLPPGTIRGE